MTLEAVGLDESFIPALCEAAHATNEWRQGNPEPFSTVDLLRLSRTPTAFGKASQLENALWAALSGCHDKPRYLALLHLDVA